MTSVIALLRYSSVRKLCILYSDNHVCAKNVTRRPSLLATSSVSVKMSRHAKKRSKKQQGITSNSLLVLLLASRNVSFESLLFYPAFSQQRMPSKYVFVRGPPSLHDDDRKFYDRPGGRLPKDQQI